MLTLLDFENVDTSEFEGTNPDEKDTLDQFLTIPEPKNLKNNYFLTIL